MAFLKKNWFILGIVSAVILGFLLPGAAATLNPHSKTSLWIIIILFLNMGFTLPGEAIKTGLSQGRLHVYIQAFIFVITPLYFLLTAWPLRSHMDGMFLTGIYGLSVLPTTISSCSVFTQGSGGNTAGTMFNATLSNIAGIIISPLLLSLLLKGAGAGLDPGQIGVILLGLAYKILLPFAAGQLLRFFFTGTAARLKKGIGIVNNLLIILIVFLALSKTASNKLLMTRLPELIVPFLYLAGSHVVLLALAWAGGRVLKFERASLISVVYAAPQKTLAMGVPLLSTFFADQPDLLSIALLPLVFYHPWQLIVAGFVKNWFKRP